MSECITSNGSMDSFSSSTTPRSQPLEGLAVIGFSLRFPGEACDEESFWKMILDGRCAMTEFPKDRMNIDAFYHPDADRTDTIPVRGGHFLDGAIDTFDAPFFSITAAEANGLDPQQRILLETTYHALENAGIPIHKIKGSKTSVHTGCFTADYAALSSRDPEVASKYGAIGTSPAMLANRISWFFDLVGASVNLDSACSSSMMALDQACQGLWNGDTTMAIVAGCNLVYSLDGVEYLSNMGFLSPSSRCFSFDSRANGYARGEGFGVLIIKRVSDAIRDKDTIRAIIRSTGSNQDGRTPGVTQPSKDSQARLIKDTYAKAALNMRDTAFFEAHGTGTAVGDPIEAGAIGAAFRRQDTQDTPLIIGALKANIGHLEGASGVAALIKTIMILERGIVPPIADLQNLNYKIDAEYLRLQFPKSARPWPSNGMRRASVNSFGFGGANSHVILEDAHHYLHERKMVGNNNFRANATVFDINEQREKDGNGDKISGKYTNAQNRPKLLVWSAADEGGVDRLATAYSRHFLSLPLSQNDSEKYLDNLAYTLSERRTQLPWKSFVVSESIPTLQNLNGILAKPVRAASRINIGFVFTGQGAQWPEMGRDLFNYPVFQESLVQGGLYLKSLGCEWSLIDELLKPKSVSRIGDPEFSQPLCTALQVALVELLKSFGVYAAAVVGHSSGEIAAAYTANAISKQAAYKIAYFRGKYAAVLNECGETPLGMMAVGLSEEDAQPYLRKLQVLEGRNPLVVGCVNSPTSITISGDVSQIDDLKELLDQDSVFSRKLSVTVAYHSAYMDEISSIYWDAIHDIEPGVFSSNDPPMISSVTGQRASQEQLAQPAYWVQNMVSQVRFSKALEVMCSPPAERLVKKIDGSHRYSVPLHTLLEIGPHSALRGPIRDTLISRASGQEIGYISALTRFAPSSRSLLEACGNLHCAGVRVDLGAVNQSNNLLPKALSDLPAYSFDHSKSYWSESRLSTSHRFRKNGRHDLLGVPVSDWNVNEARWRNILKASDIPWIKDHKISQSPLYPAVGMLIMAIEGAKQISDGTRMIKGYKIKDAFFEAPLNTTHSSEGVETQLSLRSNKSATQQGETWSNFRVCTFVDGEWLEICHGCIQVEYWQETLEINDVDETKAEKLKLRNKFRDASESYRSVDTSFLYKRMDDCGFNYGPAFRPLQQIACSDDLEAIAEVRQFEWLPSTHFQPHVVHPTTFDGILQLIFTALTKGGAEDLPTIIPTYVHKMWISTQGLSPPTPTSPVTPVKAHVRSALKGFRGSQSHLFVLDANNELCMTVDGIETTLVASLGISDEPTGEKQRCYSIDWKLDLQMAETKQIIDYCQEDIRPEEDISFHKDLTQVLFWFVRQITDEISDHNLDSVPLHISRYIEWMRMQLASFNAGSLPDCDAITADIDMLEMERLCEHLKNSNRRGKLFIEVGRNLPSILDGELDPLEFLFQGDLVKDYYHEIFDSVNCMAGLGRYLDALAHSDPSIKILEIGAGTGGMTGHILSTLLRHGESESGAPRYSQYDYTDISASFFEKAQDTFKTQAGRMNFKILNIDEDPLLQGLDKHQYDVVIASSVLHATRNLDVTLENIRKVLKPGGKLILFEITKPEKLRTGFVFGLLPGWWLGNEDIRQWSPCVTTDEWHRILLRTGYSGSEIVLNDYEDSLCHEMSIIISTAVPEQQITNGISLPATHITLVVEAASEFQEVLSSRIQQRLRSEHNLESEILIFNEALYQSGRDTNLHVFLPEMERPLLSNLTGETFETFKNIMSTIQSALWITQGGEKCSTPEYGLIDGLGRVLRSENDKLKLVTLALESSNLAPGMPIDHIIKAILYMVSNKTDEYEPEYRERKGGLQVSRMVEAKYLEEEIAMRTATSQSKIQPFGDVEALKLTVTFPGLLNTLAFVEDEAYEMPIGDEEIEIDVKAVGVNFKDCLVALGRVNQNTMGVECAGIVSRAGLRSPFKKGDRVVTCSLNTFRTFARVNSQCAIVIPHQIEFKEAAALAANFTTAWHALHEVARLQSGESILIHSGAGGTGQAAIQVAQYHGAEVYTTVSSKEKRDLLINLYNIPADHIFSSRDISFAQGVRRMTNGKGVDVVLNSLAGEELVASWELMAKYGRFIEIGIKDIEAHKSLPMFPFAQNVSFSAIDISAMSRERLPMIQKALKSWMHLYTEGRFHSAQPLKCYSASSIEEAFRSIQSGKNIGKMVIELNKEDPVMTLLKTKLTTRFRSDATYLICGGLGGLGRSISRWMASKGAKYLILLSRSGAHSAEAIKLIEELQSKGVHVKAPACDVADVKSLASVLKEARQVMPPIKGCIQAAMVLKDSVFANMTHESWKAAIASKVQGSWNLHNHLRDLEFFILLSSITGVLGAAGQANYAAGNTYLDALARYRISKGQPAISLDLGVMKGEGFLAENKDLMKRWAGPGYFIEVPQEQLFAMLDYYCDSLLPLPTELKSQPIIGIDVPSKLRSRRIELPYWMRRPLIRHLHQIDSVQDTSTATQEAVVNYSILLSDAESLNEAGLIIAQLLRRKHSLAFVIPEEQIHLQDSLVSHGVDSLVAVELRSWFGKEFGVDIAIFDLLGGATFIAIGMMAAKKSPFSQNLRDDKDKSDA